MGTHRSSFALAALLLGLALPFATDAAASDPPIGVAEVTATEGSRDVDVSAVRAMVDEAVGALDTGKLPRNAPALLSVSVVRLDAREPSATSPASPAEVTCVVSATLRDRARGVVFAVVEGSARGQDEPRRLRVLQRATLRAAVSSAIARVPEAMSRRKR